MPITPRARPRSCCPRSAARRRHYRRSPKRWPRPARPPAWPNGAAAARARCAARGVDWGYVDLFQHEVQGGIAALRQRLRERPVALIGHSLGGHLGLMARAQGVSGLAGVLAVASGTPTLRFFSARLRWQIRVVLAAHGVSGPLLGYFPGDRLGFGGRQSRRLMDEWALLARLGRFEIGGRNLLELRSEAARRIPVHSLSLPRDTYAPRAAAAHLLQLAGLDAEGHIERFDVPGPHGLPFGHFDWLKSPQTLATRMHAIVAGWAADPSPRLRGEGRVRGSPARSAEGVQVSEVRSKNSITCPQA
ncbi:MAG: hypothetical protein U1F49_08305 [Rubrivivax sp.]